MQFILIALSGIFIGILISMYLLIDEFNKKDRKIANQAKMIENKNEMLEQRNTLINDQRNKLSAIKEHMDKHYYEVKTLENAIKKVLSNDRKSAK